MPHKPQLKNERGQTMVEFALALPLICILLFGVVQFGIVYNNYITLTDAVRAGARKAAVSRSAVDPVGATKTAVVNSGSNISIANGDITVSSDWQPGHDVTVTAKYPYTIDLLGVITVKTGQLTSTTTERVE